MLRFRTFKHARSRLPSPSWCYESSCSVNKSESKAFLCDFCEEPSLHVMVFVLSPGVSCLWLQPEQSNENSPLSDAAAAAAADVPVKGGTFTLLMSQTSRGFWGNARPSSQRSNSRSGSFHFVLVNFALNVCALALPEHIQVFKFTPDLLHKILKLRQFKLFWFNMIIPLFIAAKCGFVMRHKHESVSNGHLKVCVCRQAGWGSRKCC